MGRNARLDCRVMQEVADQLEAAAANILLVRLTWPQSDDAGQDMTVDLHVESAQQWVSVVVDLLLDWSERAQQIAAALERLGRQRPGGWVE